VIGEASRCERREDERAWLNCYYAAAQPLRASLGLASTRQAPGTAKGTSPMNVRADAPSESNWLLGSGSKEAVVRMASYTFDASGHFTVTLDNGDVWRQMPGDVKTPRWIRPASTYVAAISHGALGSRNFTIRGMPGTFKVKQVR
jgi:hypothetical protein